MLKKIIPPLMILVLTLSLGIAQAADSVKIHYQETILGNGLTVITSESHNAPVVSLCVTYNVGSRNEQPGHTGFAHLFEHMMFKGSQNVHPGEHFILIFNNGGQMNGTTSQDRTNYYDQLPSNQLDLLLFLESDRMRSLAVNQVNLDNQRQVVEEEKRFRIDNQPYGKTSEVLEGLMYDNFAYKHSVMGSMADLDAASLADVKNFFRTYYAPNNAVLTLVGDFNTQEALSKIRHYFGDIPRQPTPFEVNMAEPLQSTKRETILEDPLAKFTEIDLAYKAAPGNTPDYYALTVVSSILQSGESSRLYQKLVKETQVATKMDGEVKERRGPGALYIAATLSPDVDPKKALSLVNAEIKNLQEKPASPWELEKAKNGNKLALLSLLHSSLWRAILLGKYTLFYHDPNLINTELSKINAVNASDVMRVAKQYLRESNSTLVITVPTLAKGGSKP